MKYDINAHLRTFSGEHVHYIANPGNAGDSVISSAAYQLFNRNKIEFTVVSPKHFDSSGKVVFYGGGGNLVAQGRHSHRTISRFHRLARRFVILPHTIKDIDDLLHDFGENVIIMTREPVSFKYVSNSKTAATAILTDDLAFHLDLSLFSRDNTLNDKLAVVSDYIAAILRRQGHTSLKNFRNFLFTGKIDSILQKFPDKSKLNCFRMDDERTDIDVPEDNFDLPKELMFGVTPISMAFYCSRAFIYFISKFELIRTNRLHVAIVAALLGRQVEFFRNNYFKCQAIYEFSMADRFPNVRWMG